jgi:hypothetical protein
LDASLDQDAIQSLINELVQKFLKSKGIKKQTKDERSSSTLF